MKIFIFCMIMLFYIFPCYSASINNDPNLFIMSEYKIDTWEKTKFELLKDADIKKFSTLILDETKKYPVDFFKTIGLKYIVVCKNLSFDNQYRASVPDNYKSTLYISYNERYSKDYLIHCFHHELNHYTEFYLFKDYYHKLDNWPGGDSRKKGGIYAYNNSGIDWYSIDINLHGFINKYSTLSQEEDRSEIIAFFLNDSSDDYLKTIDKVKSDIILRKKCELLFTLYSEQFQFSSLLNTLNSKCELNQGK